MDRLAQATALIDFAERDVDKVRNEYEQNLLDHTISPALQIAVKNVVDNLRSALDFTARAIFDAVGDGSQRKIYFPIATSDAKPADFASLANSRVPGIKDRPELVAYLASVQAFAGPEFAWLPRLATLANENKHERLTPQKRVETNRTTVQSAGGVVSWGPGVTFGSGISIGGVPVDPRTQLPVPHPSQKVTRERWVDFLFEETGDSVLAFLDVAAGGTRRIVSAMPPL